MEKYGKQFKEMNKLEKIKHIWVYYRYHILAGIIACFVAGNIIRLMFWPQPENVVDVMICGPMYLGDNEFEVYDEFKEKYQAGLSLDCLNWDVDIQRAQVMQQKLPLMVTAKSLEIVAMPEKNYESFVKAYGVDMFMPLEEVPELSVLLEKQKDHLYTCDLAYDDKGNDIKAEEHVYGIRVSKFNGIDSIEYNEEMVIGVIATLRDRHKALCMYQYLVGDDTALETYNDTSEDTSNNTSVDDHTKN